MPQLERNLLIDNTINSRSHLRAFVFLFLMIILSSCRFEGKYKKISLNASDYSPTYSLISGGGTLTLNGDGFKEGHKVTVGGKECSNIKINSSSSLTCTLPSHDAGSAEIVIAAASGLSRSISGFVYYNPLSVSGVTPNIGLVAGSQEIVISGDGLQVGVTVAVDGTNCTDLTHTSAQRISCKVPAHTAGTVNIVITNPDGQTQTLSNSFTYFESLAISSLSPATGLVAGNETLTISGAGFQPNATVKIGGNNCTNVNVASTTSITCKTPAHSTGAKDVVVTNDDGISFTKSSFTYYNPLSISSVSPTSTFLLGGKTITINGDGFQPGITVNFGSSSCSTVNIISPTQLTCVNPLKSTPGQVNVVLTNTNTATVTSTNGFEYKSDQFETVSLFSGKLTNYGPEDGIGGNARFKLPLKIVNHNDIDFYITDTGNNVIKKYNRNTAEVTTVLGVKGNNTPADGIGTSARFKEPHGLVIVGNDMYVTDSLACTIRKVDLTNYNVTTVAGSSGTCGSTDNAVGTSATLDYPSAVTSDGSSLYFAVGTFSGGIAIKKMTLGGTNSISTVKTFTVAVADIVYHSGFLYFSDNYHNIQKLNLSDLSVNLIAGIDDIGYSDNIGASAAFNYPGGLLIDGNSLYVADAGNNAIRKIDLTTSAVTTVVGGPTLNGNTDGTGAAAKLTTPVTMAMYTNGPTQEVFFLNFNYNNLRKVNLSTFQVTTLAGKVGP